MYRSFVFLIAFFVGLLPCLAEAGGALEGERFRVIVSSDIGGSDEDDDQSMVHFLLYSDLFDVVGLISSPPKNGRAKDFHEVIDEYEKDFPKLMKQSSSFPKPEALRSVVKQGATEPAPEKGFRQFTEGSNWILHCSQMHDSRPLYVLVWGSITDVAQALHDDPTIKNNLRVYFIASWNERNDPSAMKYIDEHHPDLWMVHCDTTFRGWYVGGKQDGDLGNKTFIEQHIRGHGALGRYFDELHYDRIKMGDSPSVGFLVWGTPDDPTQPSWGGQFVKKEGRPNWWVDDPDPTLKEGNYPGAKTVNRWREKYLRDWQKRLDWLK